MKQLTFDNYYKQEELLKILISERQKLYDTYRVIIRNYNNEFLIKTNSLDKRIHEIKNYLEEKKHETNTERRNKK